MSKRISDEVLLMKANALFAAQAEFQSFWLFARADVIGSEGHSEHEQLCESACATPSDKPAVIEGKGGSDDHGAMDHEGNEHDDMGHEKMMDIVYRSSIEH